MTEKVEMRLSAFRNSTDLEGILMGKSESPSAPTFVVSIPDAAPVYPRSAPRPFVGVSEEYYEIVKRQGHSSPQQQSDQPELPGEDRSLSAPPSRV